MSDSCTRDTVSLLWSVTVSDFLLHLVTRSQLTRFSWRVGGSFSWKDRLRGRSRRSGGRGSRGRSYRIGKKDFVNIHYLLHISTTNNRKSLYIPLKKVIKLII